MSKLLRTLLIAGLAATTMMFVAPQTSNAHGYWYGYGGWYTSYYSPYYTHYYYYPPAYYYPAIGYDTAPTYYYAYYQTPYTGWHRSPYYYGTAYRPVSYSTSYSWGYPLRSRLAGGHRTYCR